MKFSGLFSLISIAEGLSVSAPGDTRSFEARAALDQLDMEALQKEIMQNVSAELLKKDISKAIESQVDAKVQEELEKQREHEQLYKFKEFTAEDWQKYDQLILYQKLQNILGDLGKDSVVDGLWKDLTPEAKQGPLRKFKIDFDLDAEKIDVATKASDNDGKPLFEWNLDSSLGEITHIKRISVIDPKTIPKVEPVVQPASQVQAVNVTPVPAAAKPTAVEEPVVVKKTTAEKAAPVRGPFDVEVPIEPEWDDLESQRDLAFKIIAFFIFFVVATFGCIYAYFKLDQKEQEQEAREKRAKSHYFEEVSDRTFFDFLGQKDQDNQNEV